MTHRLEKKIVVNETEIIELNRNMKSSRTLVRDFNKKSIFSINLLNFRVSALI